MPYRNVKQNNVFFAANIFFFQQAQNIAYFFPVPQIFQRQPQEQGASILYSQRARALGKPDAESFASK